MIHLDPPWIQLRIHLAPRVFPMIHLIHLNSIYTYVYARIRPRPHTQAQ